MDKIKVALDTRDRLASQVSGDAVMHHQVEANEVGVVAELTDTSAHFTAASPPNRESLRTSLDIRDHLAAHGICMPEGEALWREELEEAVAALQ